MAGFSFCVGIIGDFELPVGEDVRVTGCLSSLPHVERALLNQRFLNVTLTSLIDFLARKFVFSNI